jgi:hypothetical protein
MLVRPLGARLVAGLGVVLHEPGAQFGDGRRLARLGLLAAGVATTANFGQPILRERAGLLDGQFTEQAQRRLAALASVGAILHHEHLPACGGHLAQEARNQRVAQFHVSGLRLRRIDRRFRQFDLGHDCSLELPNFQEPGRSQAKGNRVDLHQAPGYHQDKMPL